jgi:hypothetical protein
MSELKMVNVRECVDILKQFLQDSGNDKLKKRAARSLELLDMLFGPDPGYFDPNCEHAQLIPI